MASNSQRTLQSKHGHLFISSKGGHVVLEEAPSDHTVWSVEHLPNDEVVLQEPIHKRYLSINHHGQLHLVAARDHTCHLHVVLEDIGDVHHGTRHQAFHNKDRVYFSVPTGETKHLHTRQVKHGDPLTEAEWFRVDVAHAGQAHHQHFHHAKDHQ